jgi:hypothetical protein
MADAKLMSIGMPWQIQTTTAYTGFILNQSTDQLEWILQAPASGTLTRLGFRPSAFTGTATTWKISIQGVNGATGNPDGTIKGGGSPASATFTNAALSAGAYKEVTLDNAYAVTGGEFFAIVLAYSSGTTPSVGVNDLTVSYTSGQSTNARFPYAITNDNGTRAKAGNQTPCISYGTASTMYGWPSTAAYTATYNSGSSPNIYAMKFTRPSGHGSTYTVRGVRWLGSNPTGAGDNFTINLYSSDLTVLQTITIDSTNSVAASNGYFTYYFSDVTLAALSFGSSYYLGIVPNTTSASTVLNGITVASSADFAAWQSGTDFCVASISGGVATDIPASRLFMEILVEDHTVAASGPVPMIGSSPFIRGAQ